MSRWTFDSHSVVDAHAARKQFMQTLRASGSPESDYEAAEAVFGELLANVVQHASGRVVVALDWTDDSPVLMVHDEEDAFEDDLRLPGDLLAEHGRGLFIARKLSKTIEIVDVPRDGTIVRVTLPVYRRYESVINLAERRRAR
jgi:anti-sigma regulatory factor (Ser/Thr protein kinase)